MIKFSIIVATFNRLEELKELIRSLSSLEYDSDAFELVIVDDGSTDNTRDYVSSLGSAYPIQYFYQLNQGPGEARNYGMREARGSYFIFLDSDCTVPSEWLTAIEKAIGEHAYDAFGGPDTYLKSFPPLLKAINYSMTSFIGTGGTRGGKKSIGKFYPRSFNMGISRRVFESVGGMNKLRHGQDMDLSARIYAAGFKVGLIPEAFVFHKRRTSIRKFFKQIFNWGVARVNLGKRHKELLKPIHFLPSIVLLVAFFGMILSLVLGWMLILMLISFAFIIICLWAFAESLKIYKNLKVALLSVITLNIQVIAYGLGMIWAWPQTASGEDAVGFVKGYYGKKVTDSR